MQVVGLREEEAGTEVYLKTTKLSIHPSISTVINAPLMYVDLWHHDEK